MDYNELRSIFISIWTKQVNDNHKFFDALYLIPGIKSNFFGGQDSIYADKKGYTWLLKNTTIYSKLWMLFYK